MTSRASFGDFLAIAHRQLASGSGAAAAAGGEDVQQACDSLARLATVLARLAEDIGPGWASAVASQQTRDTSWDHAQAETRHALATVQAILHHNAAQLRARRPKAGPPVTLASRIDAAALSLTAARDLLHTHLDRAPDGTRKHRTEWAAVIASVPVRRALLTEIGSVSRQVAIRGAQLAITPGWRGSPEARRRLTTASQWMWVLDANIRIADRHEPVGDAARDQLRVIPASAIPPPALPGRAESVARLCEGIQDTCARARRSAWTASREAAWSPMMSVPSLRIVAAANTVTSHNTHVLLSALATAGDLRSGRQPAAPLLQAAGAAASARTAWRVTADALDAVTTDSRGYLSPEAADARALALWTGRLAYADPDWDITMGPSHAPRDLSGLVDCPGDLAQILPALRQAADTTRFMASANRQQISAAAGAGRILVPVSTLPDTFDIPCAFTRAPAGRIGSLLTVYREAATASADATTTIAEIADAIGSPSRTILPAYQRVSPGNRGVDSEMVGENGQQPGLSQETEGSLERTLRDLGVHDVNLLSRAASIDKASNHLIIEAAEQGHTGQSARQGINLSTSAGAAALINHALAESDPHTTMRFEPFLGRELSEIEP